MCEKKGAYPIAFLVHRASWVPIVIHHWRHAPAYSTLGKQKAEALPWSVQSFFNPGGVVYSILGVVGRGHGGF